MSRIQNITIAIFLIVMGIVAIVLGAIWIAPIFILGGIVWGWKVWRSTTSTSTTSASSSRRNGSGSIGGWIFLILILAIAGSLFHHASREWIVENTSTIWETQVQGKVRVPLDIEQGLSGSLGKLPKGVWEYIGIEAGTKQYPFSRVKGQKPFQVGFFNPYSRQDPGNIVNSIPTPNKNFYGNILVRTPGGNWRVPEQGQTLLGGEEMEYRANIEPEKLNWHGLNISGKEIYAVFQKDS
jgi:hypothetical protein